jgi:hypothetical protein
MNKIPASTGWAWLKQGAGLFRKQPAALTTLLFANILISIAIGLIPRLGPMLAVVLIPSFSVAYMRACLMIDNGKRVTPSVLAAGFRKPAVGRLIKIGLLYLAVSALVTWLIRLAIDPTVWQQMGTAGGPKSMPDVQLSDVLTLLCIVVFEVTAMMALCFAAPLAYWQEMGPGKATFYSFFAVLRRARAFVVLLLAWFGSFAVALLVVLLVFGESHIGRAVTIWVGFLFIMLLQCAMYAGYRQIFGKPDDPEAMPA